MLCHCAMLRGQPPLPFGQAEDANSLTIMQISLFQPRSAPSLPSSNARVLPPNILPSAQALE